MKEKNEQLNNQLNSNDPSATLQSFDYDLPLNEDGSLSFYWFDAHEENHGADLYLFGKIYQPEIKAFISCSLRINGMSRILYFFPKVKQSAGSAKSQFLSDEEAKKAGLNIYTELQDLFKRKYTNISQWKCKLVPRKYAFEMPIAHGEHKFLKVKYPATMPPLPSSLKGNTFECVFGSN